MATPLDPADIAPALQKPGRGQNARATGGAGILPAANLHRPTLR
jgi:hypothetical protein